MIVFAEHFLAILPGLAYWFKVSSIVPGVLYRPVIESWLFSSLR